MTRDTYYLIAGPVVLSPATDDHLEAIAAACADRTAAMMLAHWAPGVLGTAKQREDALYERLFGPLAWAVTPWVVRELPRRGDRRGQRSRIIGLRFVEKRRSDASAHCGGWISKQHRRRGYGSAALTAALAYTYQDPAVERVTTGTRLDNLAAQANLARCGFELYPEPGIAPNGTPLGQWTHQRANRPNLTFETSLEEASMGW